MAQSLRRIQGFGPETLSHLGNQFHVYALIDPRWTGQDPRKYFYVGKGEGNRCFAHAREEVKQSVGEPGIKLKTIREVRKATGEPPPIEIIDCGLSADDAFRLESILIKLLKTEGNSMLGRRAHIHCVPVEDLDASHASPILPSDIGAPALLVNL